MRWRIEARPFFARSTARRSMQIRRDAAAVPMAPRMPYAHA
ncbi:hypothetical protein GLE_3954 [Lysobacter enzymogenes]|uniref:Uncharacterized protein n=1 Tax=Lysobacter enzymogenes TaxID=69 RepID=A0A0S2DLC4_LYSEN|nr:hypothetical protein GLE_3954 [Lysobacter enzymogenes]